MNSSFPLGMVNESDCENKPVGEDNTVGEYTDEEITLGKRYSVEASTDKLYWGWITVAGDIESC